MASPGGKEIGRVSIRVVPDTSRLPSEIKTELDEIEARTSLHISTELDTSGLSEHAKAAVEEANAAAGKIHIETDVDKSGLQQATQGIGALATAIITLGPALVPLGAALVAVFFPLLGILTAATAGVGAFAAVAVPQILAVVKARQDHAAAEKAYNEAVTNKDRLAALKDEQAALAGLTPAQLAASKALDSLGHAFTVFQNTLAPTVLPIFTKGLDLLAKALPGLAPFATAASAAFSTLLDQVAAFGSSSAGKQLVAFFSAQVGPAILTLGRVAGAVFIGLGGLMKAFGPLIAPISKALDDATASFARFGVAASGSSGFATFLAYLQKVGPQVIAFLGAFIAASVKLIVALAPIGGVILVGVTAVLSAFSHLPTDVVTTLAVALIAVVVAIQAVTVATTIMSSALFANPIGLVVLALIALGVALVIAYNHVTFFRNAVNAVWAFLKPFVIEAVTLIGAAVVQNFKLIRSIAEVVWPGVKLVVTTAVTQIVAIVRTIQAIVGVIRDAFNGAKDAASTAINALVSLVRNLPSRILGALGDLGHLLYNAGRAIIQGLIDGIQSMIGAVTGAIGKVAGVIASHLPGSPVKTGPLKVLNDGYAGKQIVRMIADGINGSVGLASSAMGNVGAVGAASLGTGAAVGAGHNITVNAAPNVPTEQQIANVLRRMESLQFQPA